MKEFDCLSETQSVEGHYFLEASAGTGKTFAIENVVARLLANTGQPKQVNEILLVTFTRAATRDMRDRILRNLENHSPPLIGAIAHFDEAQIYTIHGFCHAMLQEYAVEAGVVVSSLDPEDRSYLPVVDEAIIDFFRTALVLPEYHPKQIARLLRSARGDFSGLVKKVRNLALSQEALVESVPWVHLAEQLPKEIPDHIVDEFLAIAPCFKGLCNIQKEPHDRFLQQIDLLIAGNPEILLEDDLFLEYIDPCYLKKNKEMPSHNFGDLRKQILSLWEQAVNDKVLLSGVASACRYRIRKKLTEIEATPPDFLLEKMRDALKNPAFAELVRARYSVAIIDEFQDTDAMQWDIFRTLFLREDKTLYLVGDPKQSIYSFRGAELSVYLQAKAEMGSANCYSLRTNYRSEPRLVDNLNRLFSAAGAWLDDIEYQPVGVNPAAKNVDLSDHKKNLHFMLLEGRGGRTIPSAEHESDFLFPYIAAEVQRLQVSLSEVAVLIKDRFQASRLQAYLQTKGIPSQAKGAVHIASTKMFWVMERFLLVLFDPSDVGTMKQILASPLAGYSHWDLREDLVNEIRLFKECAVAMETEGFAKAFATLLEGEVKGRRLIDWLVGSEDFKDYNDLMHVAEILIEQSIKKLDCIEDLIDFMHGIKSQEIEENLLLKRRAHSDEDALQILTTHMSKGLEYQIVFALGMASRSPHEDNVSEKMRQFYVALTRAKKRVYLPYVHCAQLGNAPIEVFLGHLLEEQGFSLEDVENRVAALGFSSERIEKTHPLPLEKTSEELVETFALPPVLLDTPTYSFSSLAIHSERLEVLDPDEDQLPLGADTGIFLHALFEKVIDRGLYTAFDRMKAYISKRCEHTVYHSFVSQIQTMFHRAFTVDLGGFTLAEIPPENMITESEFRFTLEDHKTMKGFADLIVLREDRFYIVDWKSNFLGNQRENYSLEALHAEMERNDYFLQGNIYSAALKKHLMIINSRPYEEIFGGAIYIFLRGLFWEECGLFSFTPTGDLFPIKEGVSCSD